MVNGGCFCEAIRYELRSVPYDTGWCHCRVCQRISGAPAIAFTTVPRADFVLTRGENVIGSIRTTSFGQRRFCTLCGTPLTMEVAHQPEEIDVTVASLDDPDAVPPGFHIFYADRIAWAGAGDDLPRHDRLRPDTRGLPAGATSADQD